jgi:hypothetical protein
MKPRHECGASRERGVSISGLLAALVVYVLLLSILVAVSESSIALMKNYWYLTIPAIGDLLWIAWLALDRRQAI